jgi:hypothetical protein
MEAHRREIKEMMKIMNYNHNEALACRKMTEERLEEKKPTSPDRKPEAAQKAEVPAENATVMSVGEPKKKRRMDLKLAAERRRQEPKDTKRINGRPQEKLASACWKVSRRATVAWRKRNIFKENSTQRKCSPRKEVTAARKITRSAGHRCRGRNETISHQDALKEERHAVQKWYGARKMPSGKFVPGTMWHEEPGKDGPPDGDNRYARKAPRKPGIETSRTSYGSEASGHRGGVGSLQNEKRETVRMGGTGGRSTGLPMENERAMHESDV